VYSKNRRKIIYSACGGASDPSYKEGLKGANIYISHLKETNEYYGITGYVVTEVEHMSGFESVKLYDDKGPGREDLAKEILERMISDIEIGKTASGEGDAVAEGLSFQLDRDAYNNGFHERIRKMLLSKDMIKLTADEIFTRIEEKLTES